MTEADNLAQEPVHVGLQLLAMREERSLSLRAIARKSGLSPNALSMIERGKTSPSVSTLYKIADALEVPITSFFQPRPEMLDLVYRKADQRSRVVFQNGVWEGLGGEVFSGRVEPFRLLLEPGADSGEHLMAHSGHEFVYCLAGTLIYIVEGTEYTLEPGDSLLFAAELTHSWRNASAGTTEAVFVLSGFGQTETPPEYHLLSR